MITREDIEYILNDVRNCDLDSYDDQEIDAIISELYAYFVEAEKVR